MFTSSCDAGLCTARENTGPMCTVRNAGRTRTFVRRVMKRTLGDNELDENVAVLHAMATSKEMHRRGHGRA